ncbi:hypothetical protein Efla_002129 [Eimeria flavescens]
MFVLFCVRLAATKSRQLKTTKIWRQKRPAGSRRRRRWGSDEGCRQRQQRSRGTETHHEGSVVGSRELWSSKVDEGGSSGSRDDRTEHSRRVTDASQGPSSTPQPFLAPYATKYPLLVSPIIRYAAQTEPVNIVEEPQSRIRRPSHRQSGDPRGLWASQLAEPDYRVAQPDVVLRASFEESSELSEEDRHRVLGTFRYTRLPSKANQAQEPPGLSRIEFLGSTKSSSTTGGEFKPLQLQLGVLQDDTMDASPEYGGGKQGDPVTHA